MYKYFYYCFHFCLIFSSQSKLYIYIIIINQLLTKRNKHSNKQNGVNNKMDKFVVTVFCQF